MILVAEFLDDRSRRVVVEVADRAIKIGRSPACDETDAEPLRISWNDRLVNRDHSIARRDGDHLIVERLPASPGRNEPNRMYRRFASGQRELLEDPLRMAAGDSFVIGRQGRTAIHWLHSVADLKLNQQLPQAESQSREADAEPDELSVLNDYTLRLQLRLLQRELPEQVLSGWTDERDLLIRAAAFLHQALPGQRGVSAAFLAVEPEVGPDGSEFELLSPDPNIRADFQPSRALLGLLGNTSEAQVWTPQSHPDDFARSAALNRPIEWIAAVPVCAVEDDASVYRDSKHRPVWLYVETVQSTSNASGEAFIPFLRLIVAMVASLLSAREKQRIQDQMSAYFSPALREKMRGGDQRALEPAMTDCTVIFVDRRGSSKVMETARSDEEILDQLRDNQDIVGEITQTVFDHNGVITDFSGDGVLALWGWPPDVESRGQHARLAVQAAADIAKRLENRAEFDASKGKRISAIRIGVSTGRIAVGKTGPAQQMHLSVFGSVVNLGARLERIAKDFHIPVLVSGETVDRLNLDTDTDEADAAASDLRFRRLCYIKPAGFEESYPVHELILPAAAGGSGIGKSDSRKYEQALKAFVERRWSKAQALLKALPANDRPSVWLAKKVNRFARKPPPQSWKGEIESLTK
jgi:class 3 adenylate cyclase